MKIFRRYDPIIQNMQRENIFSRANGWKFTNVIGVRLDVYIFFQILNNAQLHLFDVHDNGRSLFG